MNRIRTATVVAALLVGSTASTAWAGPLDDLEPGHWYEVPNSNLAPHMPPSTGDDWGGSQSVMSAWSGGSFDTTRDRLIVWGGGHHDYAGNEVYVFDVATLAWSRLTERSTDVGGDESSGYYPDGTPRSRHTYEYVEYVPAIDRFCSLGGSALFPSGQVGIANVDCFDFDSLTWKRMADTPSASIGAVSAVDPNTGHVWMQGAGNGLPLAEYDPLADSWASHVKEPSGWFDYGHTADIDAKRHRFVAIGGGEVVVWDLTTPEVDPIRLQTTGATTIQDTNNPGVAYDPISDRMVAWSGGADVYTLSLDTGEWELHPPDAANTVVPPAAAANGTYGRFRYVASHNVFIVVSAIDQNVFFYKLSPGSGIVPDAGVVDAGGQDAAAGSGGTTAGSGGSGAGSDDGGGCGCRVSGHTSSWPAAIVLGLPFALLVRRRRRGHGARG
jgi:MYXO-CTERM domain-containing protein